MGREGRQVGQEQVRRAIRQTRDARLALRLMAVLQVLDGASPEQVARLMGVSRRSVYGWVRRLSQQGHTEALADRARSGRPPLLSAKELKHLRRLLSHSPQEFGFFCTEWTAAVLRTQLQREGRQQVSEDTLRAALHRLGYVWKRPRYILAPDPEREKKARSSLVHPLLDAPGPGPIRGRNRPAPLPAAACRLGRAWPSQARCLSGRNAKCVLFGALDALSGELHLLARQRQRAEDFCAFLRHLRARHQQQVLVLVLDEDSSHTAHRSQALADELGIILLFLPKRSPHLNPVDHLWRAVKKEICANRQYASLEDELHQVVNYMYSLPPREVLTKAGIYSPSFWVGCLRPPVCKNFFGPT